LPLGHDADVLNLDNSACVDEKRTRVTAVPIKVLVGNYSRWFIEVHCQDNEALFLKPFKADLDMRHLDSTWPAPSRPEIDQNWTSPQLAELKRFTIQGAK
jgi:hypothetical protein